MISLGLLFYLILILRIKAIILNSRAVILPVEEFHLINLIIAE